MTQKTTHKVKCTRCGHTTESTRDTALITCGGCGYKTKNEVA